MEKTEIYHGYYIADITLRYREVTLVIRVHLNKVTNTKLPASALTIYILRH